MVGDTFAFSQGLELETVRTIAAEGILASKFRFALPAVDRTPALRSTCLNLRVAISSGHVHDSIWWQRHRLRTCFAPRVALKNIWP